MARPKGSKNKPKDNGAGEAQEHVDAAATGADPTETMAARTLRGDVRDLLLREFKTTPVAWSFMKEDEQERVILRCTEIAENVVNRAILIAASETVPHVAADIGKITLKDGLKLEMSAVRSLENVTRLEEHHGSAVILLIDPQKYMGQRKPAKPDVCGSLRMPLAPEPPGVRGDELPPEPGCAWWANGAQASHCAKCGANWTSTVTVRPTACKDDGLDILDALKREPRMLPPPSADNRPDTSARPFNDFDDEGPRH